MAERRMFAKTIVLSDAFLDMPMSARCLYFTLGMLADDDGFVNSPRSIMRQAGASIDDLNLLMVKRFILAFDSGVIVIKHWRIHNYIQKDRYKESKYMDEKATLTIDQNGAYTECIQDVSTLDTQVRLGKDRIELGKDSIDNLPEGETPPDLPLPVSPSSPVVISITLNDKTEYPITEADIEGWKDLYPAVDVMQELRKMKGWADANPTKRKTKAGIKRFINAWLSKEQDRYHGPADSGQQPYQGGGYRNAAPHGADRILEMIDRGDFDE